MALTLLPTAAMAEGETATLQSQIATSGTVTLDKDYTEDITIPANANITLDLNGETLSNTNSGKATLSVEGTAVVKNGTISGGTGYYNIEVKAGGSLTLEDVTATAGNNGSSMKLLIRPLSMVYSKALFIPTEMVMMITLRSMAVPIMICCIWHRVISLPM